MIKTIAQAFHLRDKLFTQMLESTDPAEKEFLQQKINILTAHIKGDLPL